MKVAAVILAAGASTRLGQPKQLVTLNGERLLDRAVRVAEGAGCAPVLVVLGADAKRIQSECHLDTIHLVLNTSWPEGMGSSLACGFAALPADCDAAVVMTCDQPAVTSTHLAELILHMDGQPIASAYAGRQGVPACFPASSFPQLRGLTGDAGARSLLRAARALDLPAGDLDIDTPEALLSARASLRSAADEV